MNSAAFHSRRRRIAHALANHSNLSLRVDVDVVLVLALIQRSRRSPRSFAFASTLARASSVSMPNGRPSGWFDRRSQFDAIESDVEIGREPNRRRTEPTSNRTEPTSNRTRRTLGGGVSRSRARRTRHSSASFAHFPSHARVDANGRADASTDSHRMGVSCVTLRETIRVES